MANFHQAAVIMPRPQFSIGTLLWLTLVVGLWLAFFSTVRGEAVAFQAVTAVCLTAAFAGAGLFILGACMNVDDDWRRGAAHLRLIVIGAALMALAGFSAAVFWHGAYGG